MIERDAIRRNLATIHAVMAERGRADATLIAVSKGQDPSAVEMAMAEGQKIFGENRVQEAKAKFGPLREKGVDFQLHLIGPLQTNKAEDAVRLFDAIQTLDRPHLAAALAKAIHKTGRSPELSIEVNSGREPQKAGCSPDDLADFLRLCRVDYNLTIHGLMCIPPQGKDPRPYFRLLKAAADQHGLQRISMGMSDDYPFALDCGATHIRIGRALFGGR